MTGGTARRAARLPAARFPDLVVHDLATPVAVTVPVVTYKTAERESAEPARRDKRRSWARP